MIRQSFRAATVAAALMLAAFAALFGAACATGTFARGTVPSAATPCATGGTPVAIKHVIVIMEENETYSKVIGSSNAPYQNKIAKECGLASNAHNTSHPSLPNYIGLTAGQELGSAANGDGKVSATTAQTQNNIFHELGAAGLSWRVYAESMPSTTCGKTDSSLYAQRHTAAPYFTDLGSGTGADGSCAKSDVQLSGTQSGPAVKAGAFKTALDTSTLPTFSLVVPNLCDDGHDACNSINGVKEIDNWLHGTGTTPNGWLPYIFNSPEYVNGSTAVMIVYDEGEGTGYSAGEHCWDASHVSNVSCHIPVIVASPRTPAAVNPTDFNQQDILNGIAGLAGVPKFPATTTGAPTGHNFDTGFGLQ